MFELETAQIIFYSAVILMSLSTLILTIIEFVKDILRHRKQRKDEPALNYEQVHISHKNRKHDSKTRIRVDMNLHNPSNILVETTTMYIQYRATKNEDGELQSYFIEKEIPCEFSIEPKQTVQQTFGFSIPIEYEELLIYVHIPHQDEDTNKKENLQGYAILKEYDIQKN